MSAGIRLTHDEAAERFSAAGLVLLETYVNQKTSVLARCAAHDQVRSVLPGNIFKGQRLWCCGNSGRSCKHTGKVVAESTRQKLRQFRGDRCHQFGVARSEETKRRVSDGLRRSAAASVDYAINKAASGKTSGKVGTFYIIRCGNGLLKFGSVVKQSMKSRFSQLRHYTGHAEMVASAIVPDAGAYEAAMMNRHRAYWVRGEFFRDFVSSP